LTFIVSPVAHDSSQRTAPFRVLATGPPLMSAHPTGD